nr:MAG TPA: hypothetical protein [Caudoviricetes sp.]
MCLMTTYIVLAAKLLLGYILIHILLKILLLLNLILQ